VPEWWPVVVEKDLRLGASRPGLGIPDRRARRTQHCCRSCRTHGLHKLSSFHDDSAPAVPSGFLLEGSTGAS